MKKILLSLAILFLFSASANAATKIIENYDAAKLKQDIIGIYALKGAVIESNKLNEYSFTVKTRYLTLWSGYQFKEPSSLLCMIWKLL